MSGNFLGHVVAVNTEFRNLTKSLDDLFEPQKKHFLFTEISKLTYFRRKVERHFYGLDILLSYTKDRMTISRMSFPPASFLFLII